MTYHMLGDIAAAVAIVLAFASGLALGHSLWWKP